MPQAHPETALPATRAQPTALGPGPAGNDPAWELEYRALANRSQGAPPFSQRSRIIRRATPFWQEGFSVLPENRTACEENLFTSTVEVLLYRIGSRGTVPIPPRAHLQNHSSRRPRPDITDRNLSAEKAGDSRGGSIFFGNRMFPEDKD